MIPYSPRKPTNEEWAECRAWAREFRARRRELERLAQCEWIGEVKGRLGLMTADDDCQKHGDRCRMRDNCPSIGFCSWAKRRES